MDDAASVRQSPHRCPSGDYANSWFGGGQANSYVYAANDPLNRLDVSGLWSAFGWRGVSARIASLGPVRLLGEGVGIIGYDSSSAILFGSAIAAAGGELGPVDVVGGKEWSTPILGSGTSSTGILLGGVTFPVLGLEATAGLYRTSGGE